MKFILPLALSLLSACACLTPGETVPPLMDPGDGTTGTTPGPEPDPGPGPGPGPEPGLGNPGNAKGVGRAGEDPPGRGGMNSPEQGGPGTRGASDGHGGGGKD